MSVIKFYLAPYEGPAKAEWATEAVALAQGFKELGITFYANIDYWLDPVSHEYLFKTIPVDVKPDIHVVYGDVYFMDKPQNIPTVPKDGIRVFLERNDYLTPYWQFHPYEAIWDFDLILIDHYHEQIKVPGKNVQPWQIGFTNRIMQYITKYGDEPTKPAILDTFRLHHNIRMKAIGAFSELLKDVYPTERKITEGLDTTNVDLPPIDLEYWKQTGKRHNPDYYKLINQYLLTYCYGGFYKEKPTGHSGSDKLIRQFYKLRKKLDLAMGKDESRNYYLYQWDSYRFWEVLLSNSCPLFLDFEDWGFRLPVMPVNGEHYIGVNGFDFESTAQQIKNTSVEKLKAIAENGKKWAIEHYAPVAQARRFMQHIEDIRK